jgi:hypothetical protein
MISFSSGQSEASERPAPIELAAFNLFTSGCRIASTCVLFPLRPQGDCQWRDGVRILQRQEEAPHVALALPPARLSLHERDAADEIPIGVQNER